MTVGILTISDRSARGEREDRSGPMLVQVLQGEGWKVIRQDVVSDDQGEVERALVKWADDGELAILITTGGTGFGPRDHAPEATANVIDRPAPGLAEAMRAGSLKVTPHAMLSRAVCGIRGGTLIVNLPGSPNAAVENLKFILPALPHAAQLLRGKPSSDSGHEWTPDQEED